MRAEGKKGTSYQSTVDSFFRENVKSFWGGQLRDLKEADLFAMASLSSTNATAFKGCCISRTVMSFIGSTLIIPIY